MTGAEAVNTAIYNEKIAADHYQRLAETCRKAGNNTVADFFVDQSKRETGHYNRLFKFKDNHPAYSTGSVGEAVKWVTREASAGTQAPLSVDLDDALQVVEEAERNAETFYLQAGADADDKELSELFGWLADEEAHHLYLAQKIRAKLEQGGVIEPPDYDDLGMG